MRGFLSFFCIPFVSIMQNGRKEKAQESGQAAMEYLAMYGWAVLVIAIVIAALMIFGVFGIGTPAKLTCAAGQNYLCTFPIFYTNDTVVVRLGVQQPTMIVGTACGNVGQAPSTFLAKNISMQAGQVSNVSFQCLGVPQTVGASFTQSLYIKYSVGASSTIVDKVGTITGRVNKVGVSTQITTSTSTTATATTTSTVSVQYAVCTYANPNSIEGGVLLNGVSYQNGQVAQIQIGMPYNISPIPVSSYIFSSWNTSRSVYVVDPRTASTQVSFSNVGWNGTCVGNLIIKYQVAPVTTTSTVSTTTVSTSTTHPTTSTAPQLLAGNLIPSSPTIYSGQGVTLTTSPSGGVTPYSYLWYSGTSSTCGSDSMISGATANTYFASPTSNTYYCYKVTDNQSNTNTSATDLLTVSTACGIAPTGMQHCIPLKLSNSQSSAVSSGTQIAIAFNAPAYFPYEASNMMNLFAYNGVSGATVPLWLEGNVANEMVQGGLSSNVLTYWLKLPDAIPASGTDNNIYIGLLSTTASAFANQGTYQIGEAPQLSTTYGQYDIGANVFNSYWNFAGSLAPSGITKYSSSGSVAFNNGVTIKGGTSATGGENGVSIPALSIPGSVDFYGTLTTSPVGDSRGWNIYGLSNYLGSSDVNPAAGGSYLLVDLEGTPSGVNCAPCVSGNAYSSFGGANTVGNVITSGNYVTAKGTYNVFTMIFTSTSLSTSVGYSSTKFGTLTGASGVTSLPFALTAGNNEATYAPNGATIYWLRTRVYPPNGIMPSVSFNAIQ